MNARCSRKNVLNFLPIPIMCNYRLRPWENFHLVGAPLNNNILKIFGVSPNAENYTEHQLSPKVRLVNLLTQSKKCNRKYLRIECSVENDRNKIHFDGNPTTAIGRSGIGSFCPELAERPCLTFLTR